MSKIGEGYGSEFHLRSALGTAGASIESEILSALTKNEAKGWAKIEWHPNYIDAGKPELRGMDFLPDAGGEAWKRYWPDPKAGRDPNRKGIHNWDGVGRLISEAGSEWLLVEAKAHVAEFLDSPPCGAGTASRALITKAFQKTRHSMGLALSANDEVPASWFSAGGYQIANRLASLNFLLNEPPHSGAHLVFCYYINDKFPGRICPRSREEWQTVLHQKYAELGILGDHSFKTRIHHVFPDCAAHSINVKGT